MSEADHSSELGRRLWKKMMNERMLMHEEELRAMKVQAHWKAEEDELKRKIKLQMLIDEAAQEYKKWIAVATIPSPPPSHPFPIIFV